MKRKIYQRIISFLMAMILISSQLTGAMPVQAQEMPTELSAELMESEQKDPVEFVEEEPEEIIEETVEEIIEESKVAEEELQISFEETEISAEETDSSTEEIVSTQDASTSYVISGELVTPEDGFVQGGSLTATFRVYYNSNSYRGITITIPEFDNRNLSEDEEPLTIPYSVDLTSYITEMPETLPKVLLNINKNSNVESNLLQGKNCYYMDDSWSFDNVEGNVAINEGKFQNLILPKAKVYGTVSFPEGFVLPENASMKVRVYGSSSWYSDVYLSNTTPSAFYRIDSIPLGTESLDSLYVYVSNYSANDTNVLAMVNEYYQGENLELTTDSQKAVQIDLNEKDRFDLTALDSKLAVTIQMPEELIFENIASLKMSLSADVSGNSYSTDTMVKPGVSEYTVYFNRIPTHCTQLNALSLKFNDINGNLSYTSNLITGRYEYFDGEKLIAEKPEIEGGLCDLTENKRFTLEPALTNLHMKISLGENAWFRDGDLSGKVYVETDTGELCNRNISIPAGEIGTEFYFNNFPLNAQKIKKLYVKWNTGQVESNILTGRNLYYTGETWESDVTTVEIDLPEDGEALEFAMNPAKVVLPVKLKLPEDAVIYGGDLTGNVKVVVDGTTYQIKYSISSEEREKTVLIALPNDAAKITKLYLYADSNERTATNLQRAATFYYDYDAGVLTTTNKSISLTVSDYLEEGVSVELLAGRAVSGKIRMPENTKIIGTDLTDCYIQMKAGNVTHKYTFTIPADATEDTEIPYIFYVAENVTMIDFVRVYLKNISGNISNLNTSGTLYLTENGWSSSSTDALTTELEEGNQELSMTVDKFPYVKGKLSFPEDTFIEDGTVTAKINVKSSGSTYSYSYTLTENVWEYEYMAPVKNDSATQVTEVSVLFSATSGTKTNIPTGRTCYITETGILSYASSDAAVFDFVDGVVQVDISSKLNPVFCGTLALPQEAYFEADAIEGEIEFRTNDSTYRTNFAFENGARTIDYKIIGSSYCEEVQYARVYLYSNAENELTNLEFGRYFYIDLKDYRWYGNAAQIKEENYYQIAEEVNTFTLEIPRKKIISGSIQIPETEVLTDENFKLEVGLSVDGIWYEKDVEIEAGSSSANYQVEVSSVAQNLEYLVVSFSEIPQADTNLVVDRSLYYGDGQVSEYASEITPMPLTAADTSFDVNLACKRVLKGTVKLADGVTISQGNMVMAYLRAKVGLQVKEQSLQLEAGKTEYPYEMELPVGTTEIEQLTIFVEENQYVTTNIAIGVSYYNAEENKWYTDAEKATSIIIDEDEELLDITVPKGVVFKAQLMKGDAAYFEGENLTGYAKVTVDGVDYISYYTFYEGTNSCEFKIYLPIETQTISAVRLMVYKNSVIESNILCGKEVYLTEDGWSAAEINAKSFDAGNGEINQILTLPLANTICGTVTVSQEEPVNGKVVAVVAGQEYKGTFSTENGSAEYKIELPPEDGGEYQLYYQLDLEDSENYVVGKVYVDGNGTYHLSDKFAEKTAVVKGTQYRNIKVAKWQDLQEDNLVESSHPYENGKNYEMVYTYPGTADSVTLTFSEYTYVEDTFDTIYIYDAGDNIVGTYSGGTLAGENVTIPGNTAKIVLSADPTQNAYGFGIEKITVQNGVQSQDVEISLLYENGNATKAMLHNRTGIEKKLYISSAIYDQLGKMLSVTSEKIKVQADIVAMDLNYEKDEETAAGKVMMYDDHLIPLQESNYKVYPTYSVTYNYNDAISSSRISYLSANAEIECPNIEPERSGYIFTGWYTTPECTEPYIFGDLLQENITIYAGWTKLYETVTDVIGLGEFSSNLTGGEYAQAGQEVVVEAVPEDGWMFAGWEVSGFDESEQYIINGASITYLMPQNTVYLTAKFVREIEVVWTSTGVYGYETVINEEGEEVEEPYEIFFNDDQIILPAETEKVTLKGYMDLLSQNITEVRWDYGYYLDEIEDKVNYKTLGETVLILDEDGNFTLSDLPVGVGSNTLTLTVVTESGERTLEYYLVGTRDDVVLQDGVSFMDLQKMTDAASVEDFASGIEAYWNYDNETPNDLSDDKTVIIISKQSEIGQRLMLPENDENKIGVGTVWVIPACDQFPAGFSFKIDDYGEGKYAPPAPEDDVYYGMTFSSEKYLYMLTIDPEMGEIFGDSFSITTEGVDGIAFSLLPQNTLVECTLEQEDGSQVMATMGSLNTMGGDDVKGKGFQYQNLLSNIIPKATVKSNKLTIGVEFGDTVLYDKDGSKNTKWDQLTLGGTIEMKNMAVTGAFEWHPHVNLNPLSDEFGVEVLPDQMGLILDYTEEKALKLAIGGTIGGDPSADEDSPGSLNLESIVKSFKKKFGQGENKKEVDILGADIAIKGTEMDDTIVLAAIGFNLATQTPVNGGYSKIESTSTYLGFSPVMVFMIYLDVEGEVHAKICYQYTQTTYNAKGFNVLKDGEKGSNKKIKALTPKKTIDLVGYKGQIFNVSQASKTDKNEPTGVHTITATGKAEFHMGVGAGVGLMLCGLNVANLKAGLYADAEAELLGGVTLQKGKEPDFDMDGRLGIAMGILLGFYTQLLAETPIGDAGFEGEFEKKYELASWGLSSWSISGKVKQPAAEVGSDDIPLANVKVTLRKKSSTQQDQIVYTSAEGKYSFKELDPGDYVIICEKEGYAKVETDEIELSSKSEEKDISMKLDKFVQLKGTVKDSTTREVIEGASIVLRSMSDSDWINYGLITDGDYFTIGTAKDRINGVAPGVYKMSVKADGYKPAEVTVIVPDNTSQDVVQIDPVYLVEDIYGAATVGGVIRDLATGRSTGVALLLELRRGLNNQTGTVLEVIRLESDGNYRIELPAGTYTMTIKDDRRNISDDERYHTSYFNIEVVAGRDRYEIDGYVGQAASENQIRVVLTWGRNPSDLDSHMLGPAGNGYGRFHTYYSQKEYYYDNKRYVGLDLDDTTSYGPETTTIYFESGRGTYSYYVHDYSNRNSSNNTALANSEAVVKVYRGSSLIKEYRVPSGIGTVWHVFDYYPATDVFIESGTMSNRSNPGSVGGDGYYVMSESMDAQESRDIMTILGNLEEK